MTKFTLLSAMLGAAISCASLPAMAATGVTGTVDLTGVVTPTCSVGSGSSSSFSTTIALGELDQSNGTLSPTLSGSTSASPAAQFSTQITCNTGTPAVSVTATELIDNLIATVPAGYANAVNYSASAVVVETSGSQTFAVTTNGATNGQTGPTTVANPIANQANNLTINAYGFSTVGAATDILLSSGGAPSYTATITVDITPS